MKIQSEALISELTAATKQNLNFVESLKKYTPEILNWKESPESWSILECLEHLNLYSDFYIPAIAHAISTSKFKNDPFFKSGVLGNYFAQSMLPKEKLNKMKTFKDKNPLNSTLDSTAVLGRFIQQQTDMLQWLERAKKVSLNTVKTEITLTKWVKLKLGDTFRFVINHNIRHIKQIENILKKQSTPQ
jgi:hypothetical protein